jgi:periplasmic divalent cation tolerance protein
MTGGGNMAERLIVQIACRNRREAFRIARALVEERLAACVQVGGAAVESLYWWKGKVERAREIPMWAKTTQRKLSALVRRVEELHGYDVPEILAVRVMAGSKKYLEWLDECME